VFAFSDDGRKIFTSIETSFQSLLDPELRAQKIVSDIQLLCDETKTQAQLSAILGDLSWVLMAVAYYLPPCHVWQDILVEVVKTLRERDDEVKSGSKIFWKDLPTWKYAYGITGQIRQQINIQN
jgi:hypothetical protein